MRSVPKYVASTAVAVAALVTFAQPAGAVGSISVDEGSSFAESQVITVRYKGYPLYERIFVQQCWDDPSGPNFDFSISCSVSNMLTPSLVDREEGTYKFKLFVGDEPSGLYPASCGPNVNPDNEPHATCWIRSVMTARERNDLSVWVPISFEGAKPAPATTAPPRTTIAEEPATVATDAPTDAPTVASTTAAYSPATASSTPTGDPSVSVSPQETKKRGTVLPYIIGAGSLSAVGFAFAAKRRRRRSPAASNTARAWADQSA
jgi:hypothetical protein